MGRYAALITLTGFALTAVGCAGGGGASLFFLLALMLSVNLTLSACGTESTTEAGTDASQSDSLTSIDVFESDGASDITLSDTSQSDAQACDGTWESMCNQDGVVEKACCPDGMACNFGMGMSICDDGSCVNMPDTCPEDSGVVEPDIIEKDVPDKDASDEDGWDNDAWDKDVPDKDVPEKDVPEKDVPEKDVPEKDVPDKDVSDGDVEECDGTWESMCNEFGEVDQACCPEGMACNFGMTMTICEDGSCVNMPDTCEDEKEECDGTWEQMCNEDGQVEKVCCPAGVACNYGMGMVICKDGSCVVQPDTCPDDK
jgi:hypothetical protein